MSVSPYVKTIFLFCFLLSPRWGFSQSISFEQEVISGELLKLDLNDFKVLSSSDQFIVEFLPTTLKWKRNYKLHLNPYIKLNIKSSRVEADQKIIYNSDIQNATLKDGITQFLVEYNLFSDEKIKIISKEKIIGEIYTRINSEKKSEYSLIDHSCFLYALKIVNPNRHFLTTKCSPDSYGQVGDEKFFLNISLESPELIFFPERKLLNIKLKNNESSVVSGLNPNGIYSQIHVSAQVPDRFFRLKTALGFGPYIYQSKDPFITYKQETTPSYMLYGKYDLTQLSSIKFFDALIISDTIFNNSGVYYSYDLASALDQKLVINALLGVQGIHSRFPGETSINFATLAPQGFEMIYRHPFGMMNYNFTYGGFFSTNSAEPYINTWVRFGKGYFWELNYIKWEKDKKAISLFGLSIGIPFLKFF